MTALARYEGEGQAAVNQRLAELRLTRIVVIEMDRRGVLCQEREPDVVRSRDRPPQWVFVYIANFEVLEEATVPSTLDRHLLEPQAEFTDHLLGVLAQRGCGPWEYGCRRGETKR